MSSNSLTPQERKIVSLAALGGMLEFYDFIIYGIFSVYFAHQFFPGNNELIIIIQSYFVFVLGYIARPIGGIIFSHIGDEHGRKKVLVTTIVLMGLSSLGIGLLPTYVQIGFLAPSLLLILRLTQGLALGGELPSAYVYISETMPTKRGIAFGITMSGVNAGLLLGMLINFLLNYFLTMDQLNKFGWRFPFIFGGLICIISYRIRKTLHESTVFKKILDRPKLPLLFLLRYHFSEFIAGTALIAVMASTVVIAIIFMPTYLHDMLKINNQKISYMMTALMVANVVAIYFFGRIAQLAPPFKLLKITLIVSILLIPLCYLLIYNTHVVAGLTILGMLEGFAAVVTPYAITSVFESKIRLTGVALCYNIGFTLFGGLAPLIITNTIKAGYNIYLTPCFYLLIMVVICALGLNRLRLQKENVEYRAVK